MSIDPVKIPQNVQIEDKIFGPISLNKLAILLVGGGISWVFWSIAKQSNGGYASPTVTVICWIPLAIAAAFAFFQIHHLSLLKLLMLQFEKLDKPARRVWSPRDGVILTAQIMYGLPAVTKVTSQPINDKPVHQALERLTELSSILDGDNPAVLAADEDSAPPVQQTPVEPGLTDLLTLR